MSSPDSVRPNSLETNKVSSPLKELDNSYDSRESPEDQNSQKVDPTVKKAKKTVKKQPAQPSPEDTVKETEDLDKVESLNPEGVGKKKKTKKVKKNEENPDEQGSDVTANFPKQSTERKGVTENNETNPNETRPGQKGSEQESTATKPKKTKKKAPEATEDVNEAVEEEKPKNVKKKAGEKKGETKEQPIELPVNNNTQEKVKLTKKTSDPAVQKAVKNEKPKEVAVAGNQKAENIRSNSKQGGRSTKNIEVAEPTATKSALVNALVSPTNVTGKMKAQNRNVNTAENDRYSRKISNTQAQEDQEEAVRSWSQEKKTFVPMGKALATLKKSPTQEELPTAPQKPKKGPIKSKIETGLSTLRAPSKTADISTVSFAATTRAAKSVKSPDNAGQKRAYDIAGQRSYADMSGPQKSYVLEKLDTTQGEANKKKGKNKPRMRSFDAGKTDKINAEDSFETRNKMWQIRKAEKLMEEEKKRSREQNESCTFNPKLVAKKAANLDMSTTSVYDRGLEWSQKVKSSVQNKSELIHEEVTRAEPKKPRIKSTNGPSDIRSSKVYIEGFTGPQFGLPKEMNVPSYSQEPLKFSTNLEQKIGEIHDIYESVSAALKKKSASAYKTGFKEVPSKTNLEGKSASRISVSSQKERSVKVDPIVNNSNKADEQRMSTLKQMLNVNQKEKKSSVTIVQAETKKAQPELNNDYFAGKGDEAERIVPKAGQRVEIRNNRYVIVDDNAEC